MQTFLKDTFKREDDDLGEYARLPVSQKSVTDQLHRTLDRITVVENLKCELNGLRARQCRTEGNAESLHIQSAFPSLNVYYFLPFLPL